MGDFLFWVNRFFRRGGVIEIGVYAGFLSGNRHVVPCLASRAGDNVPVPQRLSFFSVIIGVGVWPLH